MHFLTTQIKKQSLLNITFSGPYRWSLLPFMTHIKNRNNTGKAVKATEGRKGK